MPENGSGERDFTGTRLQCGVAASAVGGAGGVARCPPRAGRGRAAGANLTERWLLRLPGARIGGPIGAGIGGAPKLMEKFVIEGGVPLSGTMVPAGNKNGALPILAAAS